MKTFVLRFKQYIDGKAHEDSIDIQCDYIKISDYGVLRMFRRDELIIVAPPDGFLTCGLKDPAAIEQDKATGPVVAKV